MFEVGQEAVDGPLSETPVGVFHDAAYLVILRTRWASVSSVQVH